MTDDQAWQAPGGPAKPGPAPAYGAGPYGPPPASPPQYGPPPTGAAPPVPSEYGPPPPGAPLPPPPQYGPPPTAPGFAPPPGAPAPGATAWTPPPRPGLIPLRPLDVGTLLGASFRVLRRNPRPTFGIALLVQGIVTLVTLGTIGLATLLSALRLGSASPDDQGTILAGTVGVTVLSGLFSILLGLVAGAWLQGVIVLEVARASLGEKLTLRGLWRLARGRLAALVGWALLVAAAFTVTILAVVAIVWLLVATLGGLGIGLGVLFAVLSALALIVVGVWLGTKLCLVPSALVLERLTVREAMQRSWRLTNGAFWKTFGIQLLVWFILWVASSIVTAPFSILAPLLVVLIDPNGTGDGIAAAVAIGIYVLQLIVTLVISAITSVIQTATTALIYLDLRMRKEGLDLELTRWVEDKQAGRQQTVNPYLPPEGRGGTDGGAPAGAYSDGAAGDATGDATGAPRA